jgi:hypothetical protein
MRERVWAIALGLAMVGVGLLPAAASASTRVYITPGTGRPGTHFVLRFRAPERTGRIGAIRRTDHLYISSAKHAGCISSVRLTITPMGPGARVRITLRPKGKTQWCVGRFRGRIVRTEALICAGSCAGPSIPPPRTVARFAFRVTKPSTPPPPASGGPVFAGLKSATLCSAGAPKVVPPARSYSLSWNPATDPVTPSDKIVYDIYYSTTSGGENFSSPLATTGPGATAYSGSLSGSGAAYFVVRARDTAGHEDHNTVERLAVNNC